MAEPGPECGLAVPLQIPRDPEPRREVVVVLLHQRTVGAIRSAPGAGLLARVRAGNLKQPVARIVAEGGIEQDGTKLVIVSSSAYGL